MICQKLQLSGWAFQFFAFVLFTNLKWDSFPNNYCPKLQFRVNGLGVHGRCSWILLKAARQFVCRPKSRRKTTLPKMWLDGRLYHAPLGWFSSADVLRTSTRPKPKWKKKKHHLRQIRYHPAIKRKEFTGKIPSQKTDSQPKNTLLDHTGNYCRDR